jgi:hypothetical protein
MKKQILFKKSFLLLVIAFLATLGLSACKSTDEHPKQSEHPEHPTTNAPPQNPK